MKYIFSEWKNVFINQNLLSISFYPTIQGLLHTPGQVSLRASVLILPTTWDICPPNTSRLTPSPFSNISLSLTYFMSLHQVIFIVIVYLTDSFPIPASLPFVGCLIMWLLIKNIYPFSSLDNKPITIDTLSVSLIAVSSVPRTMPGTQRHQSCQIIHWMKELLN